MEYTYNVDDFKNIDFEETNEKEEKILEFCTTLKSAEEILGFLKIDEDLESFQMTINEMVDSGLLLERFPNKPDHPKQKYKRNKSLKEETKQTRRVLELINRFNRGEKVCIHKLMDDAKEAYEYNGSELAKLWFNESTGKPMSDKSIRRDLDIVKSHFPRAFELLRTEKGCYKSLNRKAFDNFLNPEALSLMIQTFNIVQRSNMFDSFDINEDDKILLNKKAKEKKRAYEFKNSPFEHKEKYIEYFHTIEENIKNRKKLFVEYEENNGSIVKIEVHPYKIIFMKDNFYLGCGLENDFKYRVLRISKILNMKETGKRYIPNPEIDQFILDSQTPFSRYSPNYKSKMIDVIVEVDAKKSFYFKAKNHLPSQKILEEKESGNLLVKYSVTQQREMEDLIKRWLPHMRVIEPVELREQIESELKSYLEKK